MIVKLGDIARECKCTSDNKDCPVVGLEHLEPKELLLKNYSSDPNTTFTKSFKAGQILFGRRRSYQQKASVATFDGICSGDIIVIEAIPEKVEPRLLPFIIQNEAFFNYSIIGSAGGLSPRVKWQHLANYEFELPSLDEQRVLADKLWAAYEVKESYKNLLAQTDKLLHAQFEKMFGEEESNGIVGNIATVVSGQSIPAILEDEKGDYPYVKVADFNIEGNEQRISTSSHLITSENAEQSRIIPIGTIVFAKNGAASLSNKKRVTNIECCIDMNVIGVIPSEKVIPDFLLAFFESINISDYVRQGAIPSIAPKDVENIGLFIPSMEKQLEFVHIAEQAEQTKASLNKGIEAIEAVIRSLIAESTTKV